VRVTSEGRPPRTARSAQTTFLPLFVLLCRECTHEPQARIGARRDALDVGSPADLVVDRDFGTGATHLHVAFGAVGAFVRSAFFVAAAFRRRAAISFALPLDFGIRGR
jgi:hypothetical protein